MKKSQEQLLRRKVGDLSSLVGVKDYVLNDGPGKGIRAFDLKNGRNLELTVLADRGLDISSLSYKGRNMAFASKSGIRSPYLYTEDEARGFLKQFFAGFLTTCGLTYAGGHGRDGDRELGLHGPYSNTPASQVSAWTGYADDELVLHVAGQVRESCVFEENLLLKRMITLETERDRLVIRDRIENQGFRDEPFMLVYHINFGYPMLDAGARVFSSAGQVIARDETARKGFSDYDRMEEPVDGREEECFFHVDHSGREAFAMLHNEDLGAACIIGFDPEAFPLLCQWKCMRSGDYALGLEPTTSGVHNRAIARENGTLRYLKPGESQNLDITVEFTDDQAVIGHYVQRSKKHR